MTSFKITMFLRSTLDPSSVGTKMKQALEGSPHDFVIDDLKVERNKVSQPRPGDVPDDWQALRRPSDFVTITEEPPPPEQPNTPTSCNLRCIDCEEDDHHWMAGYGEDYATENPDHPAAKMGHEVWDVCKHCEAWRPIPDDFFNEGTRKVTCDHGVCNGPPEILLSGIETRGPSTGRFCRWHAILYGRRSMNATGRIPKVDIEISVFANGPDLLAKIQRRIVATPQVAVLHCPECSSQHIDSGDWKLIPHRTHLCAHCRTEWKAFEYCTVGVSAMPNQMKLDIDRVTVKGRTFELIKGGQDRMTKGAKRQAAEEAKPTPKDYDCQTCRDFADNGQPRSFPTSEEPNHPDCPDHQCKGVGRPVGSSAMCMVCGVAVETTDGTVPPHAELIITGTR